MTPTGSPAWGKRTDDGRELSLLDHSADVAAVAEALLKNTLMGRRLARLGGQDEMPAVWIARLGYLAALHDLGKAGVRFQRKVLDGVKEWAGHVEEALSLLDPDVYSEATDTFWALLPSEEMVTWGESATLFGLLNATICHHGRPRQTAQPPDPRDWSPREGIDPFDTLQQLFGAAQEWFPKAFEDGPTLPTNTEFQHGWNGVLNLADWLASNDAFFPFEDHIKKKLPRMEWARREADRLLKDLQLNVHDARRVLGRETPRWDHVSPKDAPRPTQQRIAELPLHHGGSLVILEASTGAGKTEAAMWHFARLFQAGLVDGMTFALPTRTAATQIEGRLRDAMERFIPDKNRRPQVVLAVPGYLRVDGVEGRRGEGFHVQWDDDDPDFLRRAWAAEHSKRYLAGAVVVGTVDQVLLSALQVRHAHMRAACLLRHLLVVDEIHASDDYMTYVLEQVLRHHQASGGHALLMSATLGAKARHAFLYPGASAPPSLAEAAAMPYPLICHRGVPGSDVTQWTIASSDLPKDKEIQIEGLRLLSDPVTIARRALDAAKEGARVLVVRNTVDGCREVQRALVELAEKEDLLDLLFSVRHGNDPGGRIIPCPHHGRFAPVDRRLLDVAIQQAFRPGPGRRDGCVAVATQTVEQSLDLDAHLLITDLCPMDVLIQRLGRLHRHLDTPRPEGFETPRAVVLVPESRDLVENIDPKKGYALRSEHGLGGFVYPDLRIIDRTWCQLEEHAELRLPSKARMLVERSTHPEILTALDRQDGRWKEHGIQQLGSGIARRSQASVVALDWAEEYGRRTFASDERKVPTRLGANDLLLKLPSEPVGPFGLPVPEIKIPAWLFGEVVPEEVAKDPVVSSTTSLDGGGFAFQIGDLDLQYDRLGLAEVSSDHKS